MAASKNQMEQVCDGWVDRRMKQLVDESLPDSRRQQEKEIQEKKAAAYKAKHFADKQVSSSAADRIKKIKGGRSTGQ